MNVHVIGSSTGVAACISFSISVHGGFMSPQVSLSSFCVHLPLLILYLNIFITCA